MLMVLISIHPTEKGLFGKVTIKTRKQATRRMIEVEEFLKVIIQVYEMLKDLVTYLKVNVLFHSP